MGEFVPIKYVRSFDASMAEAYTWLTDYQDDDPQRTTAVIKRRPVVSRTKDVVVLDGEIEVLGRTGKGRAEVHLFPPDHWEARFSNGSSYDYRLYPEGPTRCRLEVVYNIRSRRWQRRLMMRLLEGRIRRELDTMWTGFAASMAQDLAAARSSGAPQRAVR